MDITRKNAYLGAEVRNINLEDIAPDQLHAVHAAFLENPLLVFKNQQLSAEGQLRFSRYFGPIDTHPLVQYNHKQYPEIFVLSNEQIDGKPLGITDGGSYWHSDFAFRERPALATVLNPQKLPKAGGNTLFVNMYKTYDDLDQSVKQKLAGLKAVHRYRRKATENAEGTKVVMTADQLAATPDVQHPIVRTHPETGRKALFAHPGITAEVVGVDQEEGRALLEMLFEHCTQEKYQYAHHWEPGDVVMWDNRCLMHRATTRENPTAEPRTIFRTTIMGDRPV